MAILFVPIERLPERYSDQWYPWFMKAFADLKAYGGPVQVVGDMSHQHGIESGEFLDVFGTMKFKSLQLLEIMDHLRAGFTGTVFFMDLWFPGLEMLAYVRDTLGLKFRVSGILHAGTYDPEDFLTRSGCGSWGNLLEQSWFEFVDTVFVSTPFHQRLLERNRAGLKGKIKRVRFPVFCDAERRARPKEDLVVFPHRLAPEKHPEIFQTVEWLFRQRNPHWPVTFVRSKDVCSTKDAYYDLLARSKVVFSSATQETFGIAVQEGVNLGAWPVVPAAVCYPDVIGDDSRWGLYRDLKEAVEKIEVGLLKSGRPDVVYEDNAEDLVYTVLQDAEGVGHE